MGSSSNPNPLPPYDSYKDCSLGICSIYCPQFCYVIFPPPPPSSSEDNEDSTSTYFSPLVIAVIGILASAFLLVSYYLVVTRYCRRRNREGVMVSADEITGQIHQNESTAADGVEETLIKAITVYKYKKGEGLVEGTDCSVCLSEFEENESLRLMPKCSHAFHLPCIDTWLKSHSSCPLCRSSVVGFLHPPQPSSSVVPPVTVTAHASRHSSDSLLVICDSPGSGVRHEAVIIVDSLPSPKYAAGQSREDPVPRMRRSASAVMDCPNGAVGDDVEMAMTVGTAETTTSPHHQIMKRSISTDKFMSGR